MTALADALVAAQRRSLAAVEKAYVAGAIERDAATERLAEVGITDAVDVPYLLNALDVIRELGAQVPVETNGAAPVDEPASDRQRAYIVSLCEKAQLEPPDPQARLTKQQASEIIESLQRGTYDPSKWTVPF